MIHGWLFAVTPASRARRLINPTGVRNSPAPFSSHETKHPKPSVCSSRRQLARTSPLGSKFGGAHPKPVSRRAVCALGRAKKPRAAVRKALAAAITRGSWSTP